LAKAVGVLNNEFTGFLDAIKNPQGQTSSPTPSGNTPPASIVDAGPTSVPPTETTPAPAGDTKQDKMLQWAGILARLAEGGLGGKQDSTNPTAEMLKLILDLQDRSEERALNRQKASIDSLLAITKVLGAKGVNVPSGEKVSTSEPSGHLGDTIKD